MMTRDPHYAEYLAAVSGMHDHTMPPAAQHGPAVGDFVSGITKGKHWSGHVQSIEPGRMVVEAAGAWLVVDPQDITH